MMARPIKAFKMIGIALALACSAACEKEGPIGPEGPRGEPGTANVIYSDWIRPSISSWNGVNTPTYKEMNIQDNRITEDLYRTGVLLVYWQVSRTFMTPLPYFHISISGEIYTEISYRIVESGYLRIKVRRVDGNVVGPSEYLWDPPPAGGTKYVQFRYVIIPGGLAASARERGINLNNFNAVARAFNIPVNPDVPVNPDFH